MFVVTGDVGRYHRLRDGMRDIGRI
jgi:hypothetical protein